MRRAPGEIVRSVRFRSNGQQPITVGYSLVVPCEDGSTTTRAGDSIAELRQVARDLGLKPVVTWSNSRVVISHAEHQPKKESHTMSKSKSYETGVVTTTDGTSIDTSTPEGRVAAIEAAKVEAAAVKEAKRNGTELPATPVLDAMNSTEYRAAKAKESSGKRSATGGGGKAVRFDDATLADMARKLLAEGFTTKAAMLKEMRRKGEGARQQRFYPIADRVLDEAKRNGTMPEATKPAPTKRTTATKSVDEQLDERAAKRTAKKAAATTKRAAASKATPSKATAAKKPAAAKKSAPVKKVTPNFKSDAKKTTAAKRTSAKSVHLPVLDALMQSITPSKSSRTRKAAAAK